MSPDDREYGTNRSVLLCSGLLCVLMVLFCACGSTSTLSTRASQVRLVSAIQAHEVENRCVFLGNVTGSSRGGCGCLNGFIWKESWWNYNSDTLNELLDNAGELGATHVFVNQGNGLELRGEAYRCAYCRLPDGNPDHGYCRSPQGEPDVDRCVDSEGNEIGTPYCEGAEGDTPMACRINGGKWVPAISQARCEAQGHTWIPKAEDQPTCEARGGIWVPEATDKVSCEAKGGDWVIDKEILRMAPSHAEGKDEEGQ